MPNELAYCEVYKPRCHGILNHREHDTRKIYTSLLYQYGLSFDEFFDPDDYYRKEWEEAMESQYRLWRDNDRLCYNPFIRCSKAIQPNFLHIVEKIEYMDYTFCIIKTFWLKILQRKWKKWYHGMLQYRKNPGNIMKRQLYGKWI